MRKPELIDIIFAVIISIMAVFLIVFMGLLVSQQYLLFQRSKLDLKKDQLRYEISKQEKK